MNSRELLQAILDGSMTVDEVRTELDSRLGIFAIQMSEDEYEYKDEKYNESTFRELLNRTPGKHIILVYSNGQTD